MKKKWNAIKLFISLKTVASNVPTVLFLVNVDTITSLYGIANIFGNNFASIAETTKRKYKIFT